MKINKYILLIFSIFLIQSSFSQTTNDLEYRNKAEQVLNEHLNSNLINKNHLVLSFNNKMFFVVVESNTNYEEYIIDSGRLVAGNKVSKPNGEYVKVFDKNKYPEEFTNIQSSFFLNKTDLIAQGSQEYFVLKIGDKKYGEYRLPSILNYDPFNNSEKEFLISRLAITMDKL